MFEDFADHLSQDGKERRRYCGFGRWAAGLAPEDRQKAEELVDNRDYNCRQLARYFQTKGALFNDQVINRHRNRNCCGREG